MRGSPSGKGGLGYIAMVAAGKDGMIQQGESSAKAARAVICSPLRLGRNFDEPCRVLVALQAADAFSVATLGRILKK